MSIVPGGYSWATLSLGDVITDARLSRFYKDITFVTAS
jgi:hypothetical protein